MEQKYHKKRIRAGARSAQKGQKLFARCARDTKLTEILKSAPGIYAYLSMGIINKLVNLLQTNAWLDMGNNKSLPPSIHGEDDLTRMEQMNDAPALGRTQLHSVASGPGNRN